MRVYGEEVSFSSYLLAIGDGSENVHTDVGEDIIQIPEQYLVKTMEALIEKVFPLVGTCYPDKYFVFRHAIFTPRNDVIDMINEWIIEKFPGAAATYRSADTVAEDDLRNVYPTEFLNSITLSGMPQHPMTLKVGAPGMLLRNLKSGSWQWFEEWYMVYCTETWSESF